MKLKIEGEQKYLISQAFSLVIAIVLVLVFFILLAAGMATGNSFTSDLLLVVVAIILLGIFSVLNQINVNLKGGKRR